MFFLKTSLSLFTLIFLSPTYGASKERENHKDIIKKAQNLTLQQDREQATQILIRVIKSEEQKSKNAGKNSGKNTEDLKKTLKEISTLFYAEKTQKLFEYSKSLFKESPPEALEKLEEAKKLEPTNALILLWTGRILLSQGKCAEAQAEATKAESLNPYMAEIQMLSFQAQVCNQKEGEQTEMPTLFPAAEAELPLFFYVVKAQKLYVEKKYVKAQEELKRAANKDKDFPEIYYWESQAQEKLGLINKEALLKYIRMCKSVDKNVLAKYEVEPRTCQEYKNLEAEYKALLEQEQKKDI